MTFAPRVWIKSRVIAKINGKIFFELSENDLKEIISLLGERKTIRAVIDSFKPSGNKVVS